LPEIKRETPDLKVTEILLEVPRDDRYLSEIENLTDQIDCYIVGSDIPGEVLKGIDVDPDKIISIKPDL
jgi:hypothetical protein